MMPAIAERRPLRGSVVLKMVVIGALVLLLLIPLAMVRGLISEREERRKEVTAEVASIWGHAQTLGGPVLIVPYVLHSRNEKGKGSSGSSVGELRG